jgi:hypothetical protein
VQGDLIQLVGQSPLGTRTTYPLQPFSERLRDRLRLCLAGQFRQGVCEFFGFFAPDV